MMNPEPTYSIQEVSKITGLPSSTLRYYEEIGLLEPVARTASGYRSYSDADLRRITFVKKLRRIGMSVEKMCAFVDLYRGGNRTARERREILQGHREMVQAEVEELVEMLGFIDYKIGLYRDEETEHEREQERDYEVQVIGENGAAGL